MQNYDPPGTAYTLTSYMFSPTSTYVRSGMLQSILEIQPPDQAEADQRERIVDELELLDPEKLDENDGVAFNELRDLEDIFNMYLSTPYSLTSAHFIHDSHDPSPTDPFSILSLLSPAEPETRHISYRLRGLSSLLPELSATFGLLHARILVS
ncbi:hypothetical protein RSAG8_10091, partial [Rhizoctonia solani AG-8 WAC10335]